MGVPAVADVSAVPGFAAVPAIPAAPAVPSAAAGSAGSAAAAAAAVPPSAAAAAAVAATAAWAAIFTALRTRWNARWNTDVSYSRHGQYGAPLRAALLHAGVQLHAHVRQRQPPGVGYVSAGVRRVPCEAS